MPTWLSGFVCAFHHATPGSSPKHTFMLFSIYICIVSRTNINENEGKFGHFNKKTYSFIFSNLKKLVAWPIPIFNHNHQSSSERPFSSFRWKLKFFIVNFYCTMTKTTTTTTTTTTMTMTTTTTVFNNNLWSRQTAAAALSPKTIQRFTIPS